MQDGNNIYWMQYLEKASFEPAGWTFWDLSVLLTQQKLITAISI